MKGKNKEGLDQEEVRIINAIIDMKTVPLTDLMIPYDKAFVMDKNIQLTPELIIRIRLKNFSRIPILENKKCIGFINTKDLINVDIEKRNNLD